MKALLDALLAALKPVEAQVAKQVWESVLHPFLKEQEAKLGTGTVALVVSLVDAELDKLVEAEIAKLQAATPAS